MKCSTRGGEVTRGVRLLKSPQETTIAGGGTNLESDLDLEIMIPSRGEIIRITT